MECTLWIQPSRFYSIHTIHHESFRWSWSKERDLVEYSLLYAWRGIYLRVYHYGFLYLSVIRIKNSFNDFPWFLFSRYNTVEESLTTLTSDCCVPSRASGFLKHCWQKDSSFMKAIPYLISKQLRSIWTTSSTCLYKIFQKYSGFIQMQIFHIR